MDPLNVPPPADNKSANSLASGTRPSVAVLEYSDAARLRRADQLMFSEPVNWAEDVVDDWLNVPVPHINPDMVALPDMDDTWGTVKGLLVQACEKWQLGHVTGDKAGPLRGNYFSAGVSIKDPARISDIQYVAGYLYALRSVWRPEDITGEESSPMFRNGFADAIPLIIRPAALRSELMTSEQARVMLREPKRAENNPLRKRLASMMTVPTNAAMVIKAVEVIFAKISARIDISKLDRVLDIFSSNRRVAIQRMYPTAQREKIIAVKGKKQLTEQLQIVVQPSVAHTYKTLATAKEQRVITEWNNFSRSENIPTANRCSWRDEFEAVRDVATALTTCAASMRHVLKDRKQLAYGTLTEEDRKTSASTQIALAAAIKNVVSSVGDEDHLSQHVDIATEGCKTLQDLVNKHLAFAKRLNSSAGVRMPPDSKEPTPTNEGASDSE